VPREQAAIQQLQQLLLQQLARLPTSAAADEELLQQAAEIAASNSSSSSSSGGSSELISSSSSSSSSSGGTLSVHVAAGELPLLNQDRQQQQQQWRASPSRHAGSTANPGQDIVADAAAVAVSPRLQTAVRARMEQKLLLREAVGVLIMYDDFLAKHF
jgi:hypothetical protein